MPSHPDRVRWNNCKHRWLINEYGDYVEEGEDYSFLTNPHLVENCYRCDLPFLKYLESITVYKPETPSQEYQGEPRKEEV